MRSAGVNAARDGLSTELVANFPHSHWIPAIDWIFGRSRNHERATMYKALSRLEAGWSRRSGRSLRDGPRMVPGAPRARLDLLGRVKPSVYVGVYN